jgi:NADPH-dependent curcumin reductase CurA
MAPNKTFVFKKTPPGLPVPGEHLATEDRPIDLETAPKGGVIVEVHYASYDPYLRGRMRDANAPSHSTMPAFQPGQPIDNSILGAIYKSDSPDFAVGDLVLAHAPIAEYVRVEDPAKVNLRKVNNPYGLDEALFLGPLGMPGRTAWSGLHRIGKPQKGETIFVSSAAGAVGQVVGQIAKREGLTVIGSVGDDAKLDFITKELGFDSGFNYKKESPAQALPRLAPKGIDIYFDNVGGDHLEAALANMNVGGRIPLCGMVRSWLESLLPKVNDCC